MGRYSVGNEPMTPAERQRRRRAGLATPQNPQETAMRKAKFAAKYGTICVPVILKSIGRVGRAGRTGDAKLIAEERERHRQLMKNLP
jgi:hypothetical protein